MVARLKAVRAAAIDAARRAAELARERRRIMEALLAEGFSQADLARELGVTRQAIQKMIAVGTQRPGNRNCGDRGSATTSRWETAQYGTTDPDMLGSLRNRSAPLPQLA